MKKLMIAALAVGLAGLLNVARAADDKTDPTGTWKWTTDNNGKKRESTLKLKLEDGKLSGTMSGGKNETKIEDATFKDGEVKFSVTRDRNGVKTTSKYSGKVGEESIKGNIETETDGKTDKKEWEAKREKAK